MDPVHASSASIGADIVDVVVPLHNNFVDANALFQSLQSARSDVLMHLIIVDDASTDPSALVVPSAEGHFVDVTLLRSNTNVGFAASVNRALRGRRRNAVILNSDTLVYDGWLDRLTAYARNDSRIGTVTPFSNAATIFSYPTFPFPFRGQLELDWRQLDKLCAQLKAIPIEVPTGVGFCMFISRNCLDTVGPFDEDLFGLGYGEDTDFCRRARKEGWSNVAAPNVFVWHRGHGSFQERAVGLIAGAETKVRRRHPDYRRAVADFIRRDPLKPHRAALDFGRIAVATPRRLVLSNRGGNDRSANTADMTFVSEGRWMKKWRPNIGGFGPLPNLPAFTALSRFESIRRFLDDLRPSELVIPSPREMPFGLSRRFVRAARDLGVMVTPLQSALLAEKSAT